MTDERSEEIINILFPTRREQLPIREITLEQLEKLKSRKASGPDGGSKEVR